MSHVLAHESFDINQYLKLLIVQIRVDLQEVALSGAKFELWWWIPRLSLRKGLVTKPHAVVRTVSRHPGAVAPSYLRLSWRPPLTTALGTFSPQHVGSIRELMTESFWIVALMD